LDVPTAADWLIDSWAYRLAFSIKSHKIGITKITTSRYDVTRIGMGMGLGLATNRIIFQVGDLLSGWWFGTFFIFHNIWDTLW
jgi:hypothetical protein